MELFREAYLAALEKYTDRLAYRDPSIGAQYTYGAFDEYVRRIIAKLNTRNVSRGDVIAIAMPHTVDYIAVMAASILSGVCYVPLSDHYPEERIRTIVEDSGAKTVIRADFISDINTYSPAAGEFPQMKPDDLALMIYTSGSTGMPKGVLHNHIGLKKAIERYCIAADLKDGDVYGSNGPFYFVLHIQDAFTAFLYGVTTVIIPDELRGNPNELSDFMDREGITVSFISPKVLNYFQKSGTSLRRVVTGSERVSRLFYDDFTLINAYGMSESACIILMFCVDRAYENTPIGQPIADVRIHVLDENGHEADEGELCVAGYSSAGYRNLPERTAETFTKNPFEEEDGFPILLHTGDMVKKLPSGNILYVNRKDWMIKINGQRVEPGEIEAALKSIDGIKDACVKDFSRPDGQTMIAAYYVTDDGKVLREDELKAYLEKRLPSYMIPAYYVQLEKLPVNANGKLDRKALQCPDITDYQNPYVAPENETQAQICNAFAEVLGIERVGIDDDFFSLGGDSIKTLVLSNRLAAFNIEKTDIFEAHTPRELSVRLTEKKVGDSLSDYAATHHNEAQVYPLTESQLSIYLDSSDPARATVYNNVMGLFLPYEGNPKNAAERLKNSVEKVFASYSILKCRVTVEDGVPALIYDDRIDLSVDVKRTRNTDRNAIARQFIKPFQLEKGPLIRCCIYDEPDGLFLLIDIHHIINDGTSMSLLMQNISRVYEGEQPIPEKVSNLVYADYEKEKLLDVKKIDNAFYRNMLDSIEGDTALYYDDDPKLAALAGKLGIYTVSLYDLQSEIASRFTARLQKSSVTESTMFFGAFAYLIRLLSGQKKVLVFAGENGRADSALSDTLGMMVHNIPVALDIDETISSEAYLKAVQARFFECVSHDRAAFSELLSEYHVSPEYTFVYQGEMLSGVPMDERFVPIELYRADDAMNNLTLHVLKQHGGDYTLRFEYNAGLFSEETVHRFAALYARLIAGLASENYLYEIPLVGAEDIAEQNVNNATEREYEKADIVTLFKNTAKAHPDNNAVFFKGEMLSYKQVDEISDRIAAFLRAKGIGRGDVVSTLLTRGTYMVTASLGVLKTGAAYQPLDPTYPSERLSFMIQDASAAYLIADEPLLESVPEYRGEVLLTRDIDNLPAGRLPLNVGPSSDSLFILLYTSGSTGTPKGVKLLHRNIANFCGWYREFYGLNETSRVSAYASYGFDANMMDLYPALTTGACVYIAEEEIRLDLIALENWLNKNAITNAFMTTQVGRQFYTMANVPSLKSLSTGGEKLVPLVPLDGGVPFYNAYGPTECTIISTIKQLDRLYDRVPIGKPLANYKVYVRDAFGRQLPALVPGELLISGAGVAAGYLNRPELTEKAFIKNEFTNEEGYERAYRSGDIVRLLANGDVDFIGRNDGQVKVRGFRIELTEVEGIIREFSGIKDATVQAFEDESTGEKFIAAYIVADEPIDIAALHEFIRSTKPPYMVPSVTMQIESIPLNQNQKVNKRALPKPERQLVEKIAPKTEMQRRIYECVSDVLGHNDFGITTDFSEAGLSSIGSIKLNALLSKTFNTVFTTRDLKEQNTVEKLEAFIDERMRGDGKHEPDFSVRREYPLSKTQEGVYVECISKPDTCTYNIPILLRIDAGLDVDRLKTAIVKAVDAHPFIKTRLSLNEDGDVCMRRMDADFSFDRDSVNMLAFDSLDEMKNHLVKPFKLIGGRLFRISIISLPDERYFFVEMHHLISDGTSMGIFLNDISRAYSGENLDVESFSGYEVVIGEEHIRTAKRLEETKRYYEKLLDEAETQSLPVGDMADGTAVGIGATNAKSAGLYEKVGAYTHVSDVKQFCRENALSMNAFFSAAFGHLLNGYLNTEGSVFAGIYNGRNDSRLSNTVAMLVKTVPIVASAKPGESVVAHVKRFGRQLLDTQANDLYSFAELSRNMNVNADVMFAYQGDDFAFDQFCGGNAALITLDLGSEKAPLNVNVFLVGEQIRYSFEYSKDRFSSEYIKAMADRLDFAVMQMLQVARMADVSFMTQKDADEIARFNDTKVDVRAEFAPARMTNAAKLYAERTAVIAKSGTVQITFAELERRSNKIANTLIEKGIGRGARVGLYMDRTEDVYAIRQGIMKAGAAFISLEPDYPDDRIAFILRDAEISLLITTKELYESRRALFDGIVETVELSEIYTSNVCETAPSKIRLKDSDPAYCIYTSGSTGNPKGVEITHKNLRNLLDYNDKNTLAHAYVDNSTRFLALAAITFDVSIIEEMMPLYHGRTVVMATQDEIHNPMLLVDTMKQTGVDMMKCTPSYMLSILEVQSAADIFKQLNAVILGAEPFPKGMYEKLRNAGFKGIVFNSYGPTETCVSVSIGTLFGRYVTIGGPNANTGFIIRDRFGNALPKYMRGELVITGDCVGNGYVKLPEKTKEVFISVDEDGTAVPAYRSGDIAYFNAFGEIMHCGRNDNQVKIRGLRVELDGIENTMNTYPGIERSVVLVLGEGDGKYLVGYYVAKHPVDEEELSKHLRKTLTAYMVPGVYVYLESLPLTVNGKVNKKALPKPEKKKQESKGRRASNELQKVIADIFAHALGVDEVGIDENFFEVGGTSMLASKVAMSAMVKGLPIAYQDVFANPTVEALEQHVLKNRNTGKSEPVSSTNLMDAEKTTKDSDEIRRVLAHNTMAHIDEICAGELGNVFVTGATGFLGIHVLRYLIENEDCNIICLIRKGRTESAEKRLKSMLMFYFDTSYDEVFESGRIVAVDGDITDREIVLAQKDKSFDTVINCAACVKHFAKDDILTRVNVTGVKNLIELCQAKDARLVQISTVSVAGENVNHALDSAVMFENMLYFGQDLSNQYARSKYDAEEAVLMELAEGALKAKIIRVGNLMSRNSDGEFQANAITSGFMRNLRGYAVVGAYPISGMARPVEFSPIDLVAEAVCKLAKTPEQFTVFHAVNGHWIEMGDLIAVMNDVGIHVEVVSDDEFQKRLADAMQDENKNMLVSGLISYLSSDTDTVRSYIPEDHTFTKNVLYRMGYRWPLTDESYLKLAMNALITLGFFDGALEG